VRYAGSAGFEGAFHVNPGISQHHQQSHSGLKIRKRDMIRVASIRGKEGSAWVRRVLGDQPSDNRRRQAPEGGDISGNVSQ
jgi:hypothetical protein